MTDQRIQSTEKMVGANHSTLTDTLNRLALIEHNNDGTHNKLTQVTDPWVDVRAYGAVGDGVTDDTAAIQAALTAADTVLIPTGTYKISSNITLTSNKTLVGINGAACILVGTGAGHIIDVANYAINVRIGNLTIRPGALASACIHTKGLNSSVLHDLYLGYTSVTTNSAHGLFVEGVQGGNGSYNNTCHNVTGQYLGGTGLYLKSTDATNYAPRVGSWAFTGNHSYFFNAIGVEFDGVQSLSFDNLTVELNTVGIKFSLTAGANVTNSAVNMQQIYIGNNTSANYVSSAGCLLYSNWFMFNGYSTLTADLTTTASGNLFRQGVNFKFTGTPSFEGFNSNGTGAHNLPGAANKAISLLVASVEQFYATAEGKMVWGGDTNLYRLAANQLRSDDLLMATGGLGAGNTVVASSVTTVNRVVPFYNASGTLLGYIPIYQTYA